MDCVLVEEGLVLLPEDSVTAQLKHASSARLYNLLADSIIHFDYHFNGYSIINILYYVGKVSGLCDFVINCNSSTVEIIYNPFYFALRAPNVFNLYLQCA